MFKGDQVVITGYWSTIKLSSTVEEIKAITVRKIKDFFCKIAQSRYNRSNGRSNGFVHDEEDDDELRSDALPKKVED